MKSYLEQRLRTRDYPGRGQLLSQSRCCALITLCLITSVAGCRAISRLKPTTAGVEEAMRRASMEPVCWQKCTGMREVAQPRL